MPRVIVNSTPLILLAGIDTRGLLLRAKERGIVTEVRPLVKKLRMNGFRMDDRVVKTVLELAHEE